MQTARPRTVRKFRMVRKNRTTVRLVNITNLLATYFQRFADMSQKMSHLPAGTKTTMQIANTRIIEFRGMVTEPQTIRCPKCGRTDYIRDMEKDMGIKGSCYKYKCINCNTYINDEPQTERNE